MEKNYKMPSIVWLKMTDYMHGWLQHELGCALRIKDQCVVCVQHLPGVRDILRMEVAEDLLDPNPVVNSMSATWKNCIEAGLQLDPDTVERTYGMSKDLLKLFVPIECPKLCLTKFGVLRPWTLDVNFSKHQAVAMQRLLRQTFWDAVTEYDRRYAVMMDGNRYAAVSMIESFCMDTNTPDMYVEAIRREWQRRVKREREKEKSEE